MFERVSAALDSQSFAAPLGGDARTGPVVVWELRSMEIERWGGKRCEPVDGALPAGYLILSEQGRLVAAVGCSVPDGAPERKNAALFRNDFPGVARYSIENGRLITRVPGGADRAESIQSRGCSLDGRWLEVTGSWLFAEDDGEDGGARRAVFGFRKMA